jgi:hypothetical protein
MPSSEWRTPAVDAVRETAEQLANARNECVSGIEPIYARPERYRSWSMYSPRNSKRFEQQLPASALRVP